jgi:hypothetical protein
MPGAKHPESYAMPLATIFDGIAESEEKRYSERKNYSNNIKYTSCEKI